MNSALSPHPKPSALSLPEPRHNLLARDRMLANPNAACVVNGVGQRARHGADARLAEALDAVEPARLEAVDVHLRLRRHVHDGRQPVRQIADAVMPRTGELA